ncbi:MAG: HAD-IIB family hydrolase [Pseudomonadota bacterium]
MQALKTWPLAQRRAITGVFTDIDDTLTTDGAITPDALAALADLKTAGLKVVAITGRPVGWSEPFAVSWPVDAIVAENGAVALIPEQKMGQTKLLRNDSGHTLPSKIYQQNASTRAVNFSRMQDVLELIEQNIPGARRATDSPGRETDIAIDHSEFTHLGASQIAAVVALMRSEGMHATVSSIHINGWFGAHNKLEGARWIVRQLWDRALDNEMDSWVYVGDSTNDQLKDKPRYVTQKARGAGFAEVAALIVEK